ncbi:MAG: mechanosensitive ion channel [Rhodospirillaceae bacterium]|nr:mechanosensitive ion channel [Rhodospirillaceae bacterium]
MFRTMFHRLLHNRLPLLGTACLAICLAFWLSLGPAAGPAAAQEKAPQGVDRAALEKLVATIENEQERKRLLTQLKALIAAQNATQKTKAPAQPALLERLADRARSLTGSLQDLSAVLSDLPKAWNWLRGRLADDRQRASLVDGVWKTALAILLGLLAEWLMRLLMHGPRRRIEDRESEALAVRTGGLAVRTLLDLLPIAALAAAAYAVLPQLAPGATTARVALTLIFGFVLARAILAVGRAVLAPRIGGLRLLPLSDGTAAYLFVWLRRLANTVVYGAVAIEALAAFDLPVGAHAALLHLLGLVIAVMLIALILQNRRAVAERLREAAEGGGEARTGAWGLRRGVGRLGDLWHVAAIVYVLAGLFVWLVDVEGGFAFLARATLLSAVILLIAMALIAGSGRLLDRLFRIEAALLEKNPGLQQRANRYLVAVRRTVFGAILVVALLAILDVWGFGVAELLQTPAGRALVRTVLVVLVVTVGAFILWEFIETAAARYLSRLDETGEGSRAVRMRTLLPMVEKALLVAIVVVAGMIVLSEIGLDIGPLLAGAGVLGLAVGFGAQTLVKDVITGVFIIVEDSMAIGDFVTVAGRSGVVEDLSVRSVTLRGYSGAKHTIPFSSIGDVENLTKDYSYAVLDYGVGYSENVDAVIAVIREVGDGLRADPDWRDNIVEDLEIAGLQELGDSAVVIRSRFKCRPGFQWGVRREMNRRIKAAFDAHGIEIPFPHTTVYFGEEKDGRLPPLPARMVEDAVRTDLADGNPAEGEP